MKRTKLSKRNVAARAGVGIVATAGIASLLAFKMVFPHSGEEALKLVPESAAVVGTIDLDPSPSQAFTYSQIWNDLQRNHLTGSVNDVAKSVDQQNPGTQELWNLSKHSLSFCIFPSTDKKDDPDVAYLIPVRDAQKAQSFLASIGKLETFQGTSFYLTTLPCHRAMVEGNTVVLSDKPWVLHEMAKVPTGQEQPVTQMAGYDEARAKEPGDATVLTMATPNVAKLTQQRLGQDAFGWTTCSMTVENNGIAFSENGKLNPERDPNVASLASVKPLRSDLLQLLPAGAYSVYAESEPGQTTLSAIGDEVAKNPDEAKEVAELKKSTGLDIVSDLNNGLRGDLVVATYPSNQPVSGIDVLVVVDNQNGADPAPLAAKIQKLIDHLVNAKGSKRDEWYMQVPRSDGSEFKLRNSLEKSLRTPDTIASRGNVLLADKTVAWAAVGGKVFISTSQSLLDQAIAGNGGHASALGKDTSLIGGLKAPAADQDFVVANLSRMAAGIQNTFDDAKMDADSRPVYRALLSSMASLNTNLSFESSITPEGVTACSGFLPIDYDKLIDLIAAFRDWEDKPDATPSKPNSPGSSNLRV